MVGVKNLERTSSLQNEFTFFGRQRLNRYKATGEIRRQDFNICKLCVYFISILGLKPFLSPRIKDAKKKIRGSSVVIFQGFQEPYLINYARMQGVSTVYMPHSPCPSAQEYRMLCQLNDLPLDQRKYDSFLNNERILIALADVIAFPSYGAGSQYFSSFPCEIASKRTLYLKSGVAIEGAETTAGQIKKTPRICFIGRYIEHKGYDLFCAASSLLGEEGIVAEFVTIGDGPMKQSLPHVTDLGWRNDIYIALQEADIIIVPNRIAYYDLLPLECAALGKPLVMTAVGGNVDQLRDLPDSIPCSEPSIPHLASAIRKAIDEFYRNPLWGSANRKVFNKMFTAEAFARRWDDAISWLIHH